MPNAMEKAVLHVMKVVDKELIIPAKNDDALIHALSYLEKSLTIRKNIESCRQIMTLLRG